MGKVITAETIDAAAAAGETRIQLPAQAVVTATARDRAAELGITLDQERPAPRSAPQGWQRPARTTEPGTALTPARGSANTARESAISTRESAAITPRTSGPVVVKPSNGHRPEGWSAPFLSSPYTPPPHPMERSRMIIVEFEADEAAMRDAVPAPLELIPGSTAVAFVGENRQTPTALEFHEGSVVLKVRYGDYSGNFTPYIWTSTDETMLAGREVSGRPKLLCEPTPMTEQGNFVHTQIVRRGQTLMDIGISVEYHDEPKSLPLRGGWLAVRKIVMPELGRPSLKQVIYHELSTSLTVNWIWKGRGQFDLPPTALSAVHELRPKRVLRAWYAELAWYLDWGKIVYEDWVPQETGDPYYLTNGHKPALPGGG